MFSALSISNTSNRALHSLGKRMFAPQNRAKTLLQFTWVLSVIYLEILRHSRAVRKCSWNTWESWDSANRPFRIALIADPQIVDNNTYSRRGILMWITQVVTDSFMRRNYRYVQNILQPDLTIFLGDLMDGGREWDDDEYEQESQRFFNLFMQARDSRVITSIPGNHDIGFGDGVRSDRVSRFHKYFGSEQVLKVGNHTLCLLDSLSLSNRDDSSVSQAAKAFLKEMKESKDESPRILLSHVPLYRTPGEDCGSNREKKGGIPIAKGYQYQNVIDYDLSQEIMESIRPVIMFAGDDHDFCLVEHEYKNSLTNSIVKVPDVTVKSFSMAMGIEKPGFQLLSLLNDGNQQQTYATQMCELNNRSANALCYSILFVATIVVMSFQTRRESKVSSPMLLPRYKADAQNFSTSAYIRSQKDTRVLKREKRSDRTKSARNIAEIMLMPLVLFILTIIF